MKVYFLTFGFLLTSALCKSQDLVFSRVIDTVLVVQTVPGVITGAIFEGTSLSPEEGKVWKIESIAIPKRRLTEKPFECDNPSQTLNGSLGLGIGFVVDDGVNAALLYHSAFLNFNTEDAFYLAPFESIDTSTSETKTISFPFWINQYSSLYPVIYTLSNLYNNDFCLTEPQSAYVYLSIIEFSTN